MTLIVVIRTVDLHEDKAVLQQACRSSLYKQFELHQALSRWNYNGTLVKTSSDTQLVCSTTNNVKNKLLGEVYHFETPRQNYICQRWSYPAHLTGSRVGQVAVERRIAAHYQ